MKAKKFLSVVLSLAMMISLIVPTTASAAGTESSTSNETIASGVTDGSYTDTSAKSDEAYEYTVTGSDGSEQTVAVEAAEENGNATETLTTTPKITWKRTEDTSGNYVPNIAYVNSSGSYTSGSVTYNQYTALTWNWSGVNKLINDGDTKVDDVWSTQSDNMSAVKFSKNGNGGSSWDKASVYKISGTFAWPEGYDLNETTISIQSANDESYSDIYDYINNNGLSDLFTNGKVIAVNDDVYVVMWVEDSRTTVTSDNINDYLLFWTGTSGKGFWTQNGNTNADWNRQTPATFISAGKQGVRAFRNAWPNAVGATAGLANTDVANNTFSYLAHTDGWYTLTDTSAINSVMRNNYGTSGIAANATVHLDLYCFNNDGEGMIDELVVNLETQRETETTVTVNYYYGNVTTPDDTEHFLGSSVLTNQAYGTSISLPSGTNASQLDYMRATAIIKAGNQDVSNGTQVNNPLIVTRGADNVINVLYTAKDAKVIYLTAPNDTVPYNGNSHTLNTVAVTESGYDNAATAQGNGKYKLPDGNTLDNVYSVVKATDPGKYPNNFTTADGSTPSYVVRDSSNNDVTGTYTFVKTPGTLTITYDPEAVTYTYDFGVTNEYADTLNDVEQKATVTEDSDEVEVSGADVTYTPAAADTGDSVNLTLTFTGNYQVTKNVTFVPATNVLYEENLVDKGNDWKLTGETLTDTVVDDNKSTVYGYTNIDAYAMSEEFSNGSAYTAAMTLEAGATTTRTDGASTFGFTGTGFDLISECGTDTGMLLVTVKDSNGNSVKAYLVDTYFTGDSGDDETDPVISGTGILDYQVPVVRNMELPYGNYTVTVYGYLVNTAGAVGGASAAAYGLDDDTDESISADSGISAEDIVAAALDDLDLWDELDVDDVEVSFMSEDSVLNGGYGNTAAAGASAASVMTADAQNNNDSGNGTDVTANVYIDGFRVYKPLETDAEIYTTDKENGVKYASVYDFIKNSVTDLDDWVDNAFVYVEYDGDTETAAIADYKTQGPQNEVYLTPGSGIAFALEGYQEGNIVQLAMKSVGKIDATANEATDMSATTATEMYYEVPVEYDDTLDVYYVVITNNEDSTGILALSGLKISSGITAMGSEALGEKVIEKLDKTVEAEFVPKVLTASAPSSVKSGRNATISIQSSTDDVAAVKLFIDDAVDGIALNPTNTKAVAAGKSDVYKYSYVVKTKTLDLSVGEHTFKVYAYNAEGKQSAPVTVTITVTN